MNEFIKNFWADCPPRNRRHSAEHCVYVRRAVRTEYSSIGRNETCLKRVLRLAGRPRQERWGVTGERSLAATAHEKWESALDEDRRWVFEIVLHALNECRTVGPVDDAVIERT